MYYNSASVCAAVGVDGKIAAKLSACDGMNA